MLSGLKRGNRRGFWLAVSFDIPGWPHQFSVLFSQAVLFDHGRVAPGIGVSVIDSLLIASVIS
jgi:hypothetical protein